VFLRGISGELPGFCGYLMCFSGFWVFAGFWVFLVEL